MNEHEPDFTMSFQDSCDKPALLLIHGFPLNSNIWTPQLEDIGDFARVIAPDLRGHGQSDGVSGPYSVQLLADDCADLLGHLSVATPFVVCGLSMGGYVALEFYRRYPAFVAGLILVATRAGADSDEGKHNRDTAAAAVRAKGVTAVTNAMLPRMLSPKTLDEDPELVAYVKEIMESTSQEGMIGALMAMKDRPDSTGSLANIEVPVLVIHGADDQLIPLEEARAMHAAIPNADLVVLPDAGHLPNLEQPDLFNDAVIDFLELLEEDEDDE